MRAALKMRGKAAAVRAAPFPGAAARAFAQAGASLAEAAPRVMLGQ